MTTSLVNLSAGQLRKAAALRERIEKLEAQLAACLGSPAPAPAVTRTPKSAGAVRRKISAAGRARLAASARARWAKAKASGRSRL
jgi:hypothetical protein